MRLPSSSFAWAKTSLFSHLYHPVWAAAYSAHHQACLDQESKGGRWGRGREARAQGQDRENSRKCFFTRLRLPSWECPGLRNEVEWGARIRNTDGVKHSIVASQETWQQDR
jgi:hypothetical protein